MTCPRLTAASAPAELRCVLQPELPRLPVRDGSRPCLHLPGHLPSCPSMASPARTTAGGKAGLPYTTGSSTRDPTKLHPELLERSRGSAGRGLRQRKRKKSWAGTCWALPHLGRNRKRPSACSYCQAGRQAGRRKQVHWNGFLLPPQLERAWVSSPNGRPCWRPPFPGDTHCPSAGHSAICPAIVVHGPRASTWCWWPRVGWGGESAGPGNTHVSGPTPTCPHTSALCPR